MKRNLGSTISCVDQASWKQNGSTICDSIKQVLSDYAVYGDCSSGEATALATTTTGSARFVEYKCCFDASMCVREVKGRSDLCFDGASWAALVKASCSELGGELLGMNFYGPC